MEKRNKKTTILLFALLITLLFIIWTFRVKPVESKTMEVEFSVGETTGIDLSTENLSFGRLVPGSSSHRTIKLENHYGYPLKVKIIASKQIAPYIYIEEDYTAEPGKLTRIPLTLKIPENTSYGNYNGEIRFEMKKV